MTFTDPWGIVQTTDVAGTDGIDYINTSGRTKFLNTTIISYLLFPPGGIYAENLVDGVIQAKTGIISAGNSLTYTGTMLMLVPPGSTYRWNEYVSGGFIGRPYTTESQ